MVLILDLTQSLGAARSSLKNLTNTLREKGLDYVWEPAHDALVQFCGSCILYSLSGGVPEVSKSVREGPTAEAGVGRHLYRDQLASCTGALTRFHSSNICLRINERYYHRKNSLASTRKSDGHCGSHPPTDDESLIL